VYKKELVDFPQQIIALLDENYSALEPGLRRTLAKALILMRNRDLLSPTTYVDPPTTNHPSLCLVGLSFG